MWLVSGPHKLGQVLNGKISPLCQGNYNLSIHSVKCQNCVLCYSRKVLWLSVSVRLIKIRVGKRLRNINTDRKQRALLRALDKDCINGLKSFNYVLKLLLMMLHYSRVWMHFDHCIILLYIMEKCWCKKISNTKSELIILIAITWQF